MAGSARRKKAPANNPIRERIKQQKAALIQEQILEVAAKLIAERGFNAVTNDDISATIGFTKSIVYYYFRNKNEILWKIFEKIDLTYAASLDAVFQSAGGPEALLRGVIRAHCLNVLTHGSWAIIYNRDDHELTDEQRQIVTSNKRRYQKRVEALYESGVRAGVFKNVPPVIAVSCLIGACNWSYMWYKPTGPLSPEEIAEHYANLLITGILA